MEPAAAVTPAPGADRVRSLLRSHRDLIAIIVLVGVALTVRIGELDRPLHGDEMITFSNMVLGRSFGDIVLGPFDSNNHLLNSLIMKAVVVTAGESPALMRLPNLIMSLLTVVLLYFVGSREIGRGFGLAAALLLAVHPAMVLFSVFARGYAGMILFTLLSSVLILHALRSFSWRRVALAAVTGLIAIAFHLFAAVSIAAQAALVVIAAFVPDPRDDRPRPPHALGTLRVAAGPMSALVLGFALLAPQLASSTVGSARYLFQAAFPVALVNFLGGRSYDTGLDPVSLLLLAAAVAGFISLKQRDLKILTGLLYLTPITLYAISSVAPFFTLHPRFFAFLLPFHLFLGVAGLSSGVALARTLTHDRSRTARTACGIAVLCVLLTGAVLVERIRVPADRGLHRLQDAVARFVDSHPDAAFLTNDTGFVRVRLRQEANMDRIRPALGIRAILDALAEQPVGEVFYIHVPQRRFSESDLIHYRGKVPPDELYRRDDRLRGFLTRNAALELDLGPRVMIYALRDGRPQAPPPRR